MSPEKSFWLIRDFLGTVITGRQKVRRLEAVVLFLLGLAAVLLLAPAAVTSQPLWGYSAVVYLAAIVLLFAAVALRAAWILKRPPTRERIALEIESERGDLGNNLISSLQLFPAKDSLGGDDPTSPELIDALVVETAEQVGKLDPVIFVSDAAPRRMGRLLAALGVTVFLVAVSWPGLYPRAGHLLANAIDLMPSRITHLYLSASALRILPGTSVVLDVRTEGMAPGRVDLEFSEPGGGVERPGGGPAPGGPAPGDPVPMEALGEHQFRLKWRAGAGDVRVSAHSGRFRSAPVDIKVVAPPRTESIELVNYPPEYTPFPPTRQTESADITAYLGSSILVRVKPDKPVKEAVIALADGWRIPLKPGKDGYLEGVILVGSPGAYQVRLKDFDGFENRNPPRYRIDILPDTPPQVVIAKPGKDMDMEADDAVRLSWRVTDDLGVQRVSLEVQIGRRAPRRIRLWGEERAKKIVKGTHVIDLQAYGMRPGGVLAYRVLAEDTDTVSGPKQGASPFYRIKIRNREAVIASLDKKLNEISSKLLDLLGDYIEKEEAPAELAGAKEPGREQGQRTAKASPPAREEKSLFDKAWEIMKKVEAAKSLLRPNNPREALASMDLSTLSRRLRDAMDRHLAPRQNLSGMGDRKMTKKERQAREEERLSRREEATESMERLASMGEDMLRSVRMDRVGKTADALMQRQRDLARALEEMRKSGEASPEAKSRLEREISRLERELNKLMQQLSSLARRMPGEFMNQRNMRNMPMQDMRSALDRVRQQMRKGDFRGALDTLRRLMSQIQRLRNAMRSLQRNQMSAQRGGRPMQRRQTELGAIVKEQQAVLSGTVDVYGNMMERLTKGWPNSLKSLSGRFGKSLSEERKLAERIAGADCGPKSSFVTKEDKAEEERKLEKALEAIREAIASGGGNAKMPLMPKMSAEEKRRVEKQRRDEGRRLHRTALDEMERHLKLGEWRDIPAILRRMGEMVRDEPCIEKKDKERAARRWREAEKELDALLKKAERRSPTGEKRPLAELHKRQKALEGRLAAFSQRLRRLMQLFPFLDPKLLQRIEEARSAMKDAKGSLAERRVSAAIPHEERVLELLAQSQRQMNRSMQQMARRGRLGRGTPRGAGVYRRPGRGWWARNPNQPGRDPSSRQSRRGQDGRQGMDFSEVLIPDREQYKVPEKFREEVMEALKEGLPDSLKSEIENYYERLTR